MTDAFGMLALTVVLQAKADFTGAMQIVEKFENRLQGKSRPIEFGEPIRTLRVRVQLASGDVQSAARWADQIIQSDDFLQHKEYYRLTLARIRLAQGRHDEAENILTGFPYSDKYGNRITRRIESNLLMAAALTGQQRLPEAFALIEASLELAEPEGYVRIFLDGGESVRDLLSAYTRTDTHLHHEFCQKLLASFTSKTGLTPPGNQPAEMMETLSARELEVLQLMALGRTNLEIAGQLIVARGTIKAHAASIFRKLDAANRTEAVANARELGLLL
jgi:LuxR family maltose regulon positive regulatory protein